MATTKQIKSSGLQRNAMLLPFKRRLAAWQIKADTWQADTASAADLAERYRSGIDAIDLEVVALTQLRLPDDPSPKLLETEVNAMARDYGALKTSFARLVDA